VQFHFHRTGKIETDRTQVGLYFAKKPVKDLYRSTPVPGAIGTIKPGDANHRVVSTWYTTTDLMVYRLSPHMHLLGKDIELLATPPGGKEASLVKIPTWDYNWQEQYELKQPLSLKAGTKLTLKATFDNSEKNPRNPSLPPKPVRFGEETTDEMCFVFLGVASAESKPRVLSPVRR
jgi:hypothetical protein